MLINNFLSLHRAHLWRSNRLGGKEQKRADERRLFRYICLISNQSLSPFYCCVPVHLCNDLNFASVGSRRASRCGVWVRLPVFISQRHLLHVHGADVGLGHRQQQHRHTDGAAGRESVKPTAFSCRPYPNISPPSLFSSSRLSLIPSFLNDFSPLLPSTNRFIFLFCFHVRSSGPVRTS